MLLADPGDIMMAMNYSHKLSLVRALGGAGVLCASLVLAIGPAVAAPSAHITSQPVGDSVLTGSTASFSAKASVFLPVRWQVSSDSSGGFTYIPGANSHRLVIRNVSRALSGARYRAVFEMSDGNLVTRAATLVVQSYDSSAWDPGWAGYALTGSNFTAASGSWVVPVPQCALTGDPSAATWVGIDGYGSKTVEQVGTEESCENGVAVYGAWYEMYGDTTPGLNSAGLDPTLYPVVAGDVVTGAVAFANNQWTLQISDATQVWSFSVAPPAPVPAAQRVSVEWIVERPITCGTTCTLMQLPILSPVTFTDASATTTSASGTTTGSINQFTYSNFDMLEGSSFISKPGPLRDNGTAFTVMP